MGRVPEEVLELSREISEEDGRREEMLAAKCNWERMSRSAVLMSYGDPRTWSSYEGGDDE